MRIKRIALGLSVAAIVLGCSLVSRADIIGSSDYNQVRINDNTKEKTLYQVFDQHFGNKYYEQTGTRFTSSNDLYDALKIIPESGQITVGENASVRSYYKNAAFDHSVSIMDSMTGQSAGQFKFNDWTVNTPGQAVPLAAGSYDLTLSAFKGSNSYEFHFDPAMNMDGLVHMVMLDLSWYFGESAFMVAIEDMYKGSIYGNPDWDFNDGIYVFRSVEASTTPATTPEPASMLIFGAGLVGLAFARRFRTKAKKSAK